MYYAKISGFRTLKQAQGFLRWVEGQGELPEWIGEGVTGIQCDVRTGMIEHADGVEYKVKLFDD